MKNPLPIYQKYQEPEACPYREQKGEPRKPCCDSFFPFSQWPKSTTDKQARFFSLLGFIGQSAPASFLSTHPHLQLLTLTSSISDDLRVLHVQQVRLPFHSQGAAGIRTPHPCQGHICHPHHHGYRCGLPCPQQSHLEDRALSRHHNFTNFTLVLGITYTGQVGFREQDAGSIPE